MPSDRTVLFVTPYYLPHVGGVEVFVHGLATALDALPGWRAVVVTTGEGPAVTVAEEAGLRVYRLPVQTRISYTPVHTRWPAQLRRIIEREDPEFLNVHTPVPGLADAAAHVAGDRPLIVTYHAATLAKPGRPGFNLAARAYALLEARMMRRARLVLGVSGFVADRLKTRFGPKAGVLENAVDETVFAAAPAPACHDVAFIARLDPTHAWKGLDLLLDSVRVYVDRYGPELEVLVIGDGAARAGYETRARRLGIRDNVTFAGTLSGEAKFAALHRSRSLALCPTSANDAFPTVLLEAWAGQVPVIATETGPLPHLVRHEHTGLLVPPRDPGRLAAAIRRVLEDPALHRHLARTGVREAREAHTWRVRVHQFTGLLENIPGDKPVLEAR